MRYFKIMKLAFALLSFAWLAAPLYADTLYTAVTETGSGLLASYTNAIWTNDPVQAVLLGDLVTNNAVVPSSGNIYEALSNGQVPTNGTEYCTLLRAYGPSFFPGDSLQLDTNTLFYVKNRGVTNIVNLILSGGIVMNGDGNSGANHNILGGSVQAASGTTSYFDFGGYATGTNRAANRTLGLVSTVTGSGDLMLVQGATISATNLLVMSSSNTFSGRWIVKSGWLKGVGFDSLGTNSSIIVDPLVKADAYDAGGGFADGPAVFEPGYDINSAGTLTLTNGGTMELHQNCAFTAVTINGTSLPDDTYYYSTLTNMFPGTFTPGVFAGGSGAITVQPYNPSGPPALAPGFKIPPVLQATDYPYPSNAIYAGQVVVGKVLVGGEQPIHYQWKAAAIGSGGPYTNLIDGGNISGATTTNLIINGLTSDNAADYVVVATNSLGSVTSSPVTLSVLPTGSAQNIIMFTSQTPGQDWNTAGSWDNNQPAWLSVASNPGSTFEVIAATWMRTPASGSVNTFPGTTADSLTMDGDGNFLVVDGYLSDDYTTGIIIDKAPQNSVVNFPRLVMNGGEIDQRGNGGVTLTTWGGEWDIITNTPIYIDGGLDAGLLVTATLTGTGAIEYYGPRSSNSGTAGAAENPPDYVQALNILGTNNTFSGQWFVENGNLLGSAPGCLGTNSITVGADTADQYGQYYTNGAVLETLYDIHNPDATLTIAGTNANGLNFGGKVYLHQNDSFGALIINGVSLSPGVYTAAQLNTAYPDNFPASWTPLAGSTYSTISGSITVGTPEKMTPNITSIGISFGVNGVSLNLTATNGTPNGTFYLVTSTNLALPLSQWTPILTNVFDASGNLDLSTNVANSGSPQQFYLLKQ